MLNTPCVNTPPEKKESADSFEIKGFSGLNTTTSFCFRLDHIARTPWQELQTEASLLALLPDTSFTSNQKTG